MNRENNRGRFFPARISFGRDALWIASIALIYFATARLSLLLVFQPEGIAAIWPPTGVFLSAILLTRRDLRPWLAGTLFITDFIAERLAGTPFLVSAIYALALTGDAVMSVWLLHRFVGEPFTFRRVRDVAGWFVLSVLLSNALMALAAAAAAELLPGTHSFWSSWQWWAASDGVGNLLVTPFILGSAVWTRIRLRAWNWPRVFEGAALFIPLALVNFALFSYFSKHQLGALFLPYVTFPFLLWAALRFGVRGAVTALLTVAAIVIPFTASGRIPSFSFAPGVLDEVLAVQLFLALMAVPALFMAAVVTEHKQAAEALRSSEELFRIAAETANDVIYEWDLKQSVEWLGKIDDLLGYEPGEFPRTLNGWAASVHPEDVERTMAAIQAQLEGRAPYATEYRVRRKDGVYRWWSARGAAARMPDGKPTRLIGSVTDITERKQAEERLTQEHDLSEAILNNMPGLFYLITEKGRFLRWNRQMETVSGYSGEEIARMHPLDIFPAEHKGLVAEQILQVFKTGRSKVEANLLTKQGEQLPFYFTGGTVIVDGQPCLAGTGIDITERKQLEAQLIQSQKLETVGKLAGGIAHEFNSIMTAIIGQSELILSDLPSGNPLTKNTQEIRKAADRAATLTRQLLAYGRKQILQPEVLDLNDVLAGMDGMLRNLMGGDVDVRIVSSVDLKSVKADASQIEQVIMNMAMNAHDAMPHGGKLTLETSNVTFGEESVGRYPELKAGNYVRLAITDTGTGMSEEVRKRLFEPFFSTKGVGKGTGLGLAMCYGIIKQSGGHISAYSEPGRGTTFKIYIPQAEKPIETSPPQRESHGLPHGTETILLVEDDPALREMASMLLKRLGYTVLAGANGNQALSLVQQRGKEPIDLLFTDVVMPQMSGKELADRLLASHPKTKVLFTSAYTENAIVHQGVLNEGVVLLQKPFTPSALAHKVRGVLDAGKIRGGPSA